MCGINGYFLKSGSSQSTQLWLQKANRVIKHRGPDGDGFAFFNFNQPQPNLFYDEIQPKSSKDYTFLPSRKFEITDKFFSCGLAHRRLAIIDTGCGGHQPMCDTTNRYWITYNGELYNYIELKQQLQEKGISFQTQSDTEVVIQAFAYWNTLAFSKFKGMFAFVLLDLKEQHAFICRDQLGVKPLYFINTPEAFYFSSEQKTFTQTKLISAEPSDTALKQYVLNGAPESISYTFFNSLSEIKPGTYSQYNLKTHDVLSQDYTKPLKPSQTYDLSERLLFKTQEMVQTSIHQHMRSDVPLATCLSGGLDSSIILRVMDAASPEPADSLNCFTARFTGSSADEWKFAQAASKNLRVNAVSVEPQLNDFNKHLNELLYALDAPIWDTSTYAQFCIMKSVREHGIKVVLDGQGADELFAGYDHYFYLYWNQLIRSLKVWSALKHMFQSGKSIKYPSLFFSKEFIKSQLNYHPEYHYLKPAFIDSARPENPSKKTVTEAQLQDLCISRLFSFLRCEDRCSMWHSVESRVPFSDDSDLIEFALSLPDALKFKNGIRKYVLREAFKNNIPSEIYHRMDKKGFETPFEQWFDLSWKNWKTELLDCNFDFVNKKKLYNKPPQKLSEKRLLFRLYILHRWKLSHCSNWI